MKNQELLYSWEDSVDNFFTWAVSCCGVVVGSDTYNMLKHVVKSQSDLDSFIEMYDGDFEHLENTAFKILQAVV